MSQTKTAKLLGVLLATLFVAAVCSLSVFASVSTDDIVSVDWPGKAEIVNTEHGTRIMVNGEVIIPLVSYGNADVNDAWRYYQTIKYSEPSQRCVYMLSTSVDFSSEALKESLGASIRSLLEIDPDALIIIRGSAFAAGEWTEQNAVPYVEGYDYAIRWDGTAEGKPDGLGWLSMCSDRWRENIKDNYTKGIQWMATQDFAPHIIGFQPGNATYFEWVFIHNDNGHNPGDYSGASRDKFRLFLAEKYGTDAALQAAWQDNTVTLKTAEIPTPAERLQADDGYFLTIEGGSAKVIDYNEFYNKSYVDAMIYIGEVIKKASGDCLLTSYLYGYFYSYVRWSHPVQMGSYALTRLLDSEYVDILSSTLSYWTRRLGEIDMNVSVVDSYALNNKVYIAEDDTRTYLSDPSYGSENGGDAIRIGTLQGTLAVLRRNFANFVVRDAGLYWMDMHAEGWYNDSHLWEDMAEMRRIWAVANYQSADKGFRPEVAYIVDDESLYYTRAANNGYTIYLIEQFNELARAGFSYGSYVKCDLDKLPDSVKVIIMGNVFYTDSETKAAIENLKGDGRTIVWTRTAGYIDEEGADNSNVANLTGMPILKIASTSGITNITNNNSAYTKDTGITSFGKNATQSPAFYVKTDASVVSLGTYKDSYYTSFAVKDMGDWKSIFSGSVTVPAAILRAIAIDAGVHSYFPAVCGDAIETDNHFLSYLAASTGEKRIVLPSASHVVDMITGKTIGNGITSFSFNSEYAGDIRFYSITAGSAKALDITSDAVAKTFGWKDENGGIKTIVPGEQLGFTFTGTFVSINVAKGPGNGVIKVKIDGMEYPDVNLNTREGDENPNAEIVLAHGLKNEKHTVILEVNNPIDYTATSDGYDTSTPERNITHNGVEVPPNLNFSADQPYNMGIKFSVKLPGRITHARLVAGPRSNGVLHKVTLWRAADQSIVAGPFDWTFETDIAQWLEFELPEPVEIEAGVNYVMTVASVVTGNYNYYWAQGQFFPRKENSVIVTYSDSGLFSTNINAFPTLTFNSSTYGRDIVFAFDPPKEDEDEVKVLNENIQIYSANVVGEFGEPPVLDNMVDWAKGDVNLDGEVDILDIILAKKYISGGTVLSESQITEGDTQHDGVLDEIDFANIFKIIFKD